MSGSRQGMARPTLPHDESPAMPQPSADPYWREAMAPYARPIPWRSGLDVLTSVVPFLVLWGSMYLALDVSYWLVLAISIPAAGFLLRTFILFHDCTHGSFFRSRRANVWGDSATTTSVSGTRTATMAGRSMPPTTESSSRPRRRRFRRR